MYHLGREKIRLRLLKAGLFDVTVRLAPDPPRLNERTGTLIAETRLVVSLHARMIPQALALPLGDVRLIVATGRNVGRLKQWLATLVGKLTTRI
jgi:hypothetical protein